MAQQTHHLHACDFITYNASSQNEQKKIDDTDAIIFFLQSRKNN